jgi:hypothetical protein
MRGNYVCIVALAPDLWYVYLYRKTRINYCSSIIELLLLLMLLEKPYPSSKALPPIHEIIICLVAVVTHKIIHDHMRICTSDKSE